MHRILNTVYIFTLFIFAAVVNSSTKVLAQSSENPRYSFTKKPFIHPNIIKDLETWQSDGGEQVVAINLPGSMGTNRYFGDIKVDRNDENENQTIIYENTDACEDHPCPFGPPFFSYRLIGKTASGMYVLLTKDSGGGSGIFTNLLLVTLENDKGMSYDEKNQALTMCRQRLLIKRLTEIPLGGRYTGNITLKGDSLHIGKNHSHIKTDAFEKDTHISIGKLR